MFHLSWLQRAIDQEVHLQVLLIAISSESRFWVKMLTLKDLINIMWPESQLYSYVLFIFIKIKFIYFYSYMMLKMKSSGLCND